MGAAREMLEASPSPAPASRPGLLLRALRLVVGYILAVAAGSVIFALLFPLAVPDALPPHTAKEWFDGTFSVAITTFILGFLFGVPYTVLGLLAFRTFLPNTMPVFLIVGALCPSAAILTLGVLLGGLTGWIDAEKLRIMIFSLPSGLLGAYLFGAIGFGYGFGRWRFDP
jgi:hypothetical protein